jgi:hypothetical protein
MPVNCKTTYKVFLVFLITILALALTCNKFAADASDEHDSALLLAPCKCGPADAWHWWRLEGDAVTDSGAWKIGRPMASATSIRLASGRTVLLYGVRTDVPENSTDPPPVLPRLNPDKSYFAASHPDLGLIVAESSGHHESWVFQIGNRLIHSKQSFSPVLEDFEIVQADADGIERSWNVSALNGFWLYVTCESDGVVTGSFAVGSHVAGLSELPGDWLSSSGLMLILPEDSGYVLVKEPAPGTAWRCRHDSRDIFFESAQVEFAEVAGSERKSLRIAPTGSSE